MEELCDYRLARMERQLIELVERWKWLAISPEAVTIYVASPWETVLPLVFYSGSLDNSFLAACVRCDDGPHNERLHPRRACVEVTFARKLPESAFPLRQQAAKQRQLVTVGGAVAHPATPEWAHGCQSPGLPVSFSLLSIPRLTRFRVNGSYEAMLGGGPQCQSL